MVETYCFSVVYWYYYYYSVLLFIKLENQPICISFVSSLQIDVISLQSPIFIRSSQIFFSTFSWLSFVCDLKYYGVAFNLFWTFPLYLRFNIKSLSMSEE